MKNPKRRKPTFFFLGRLASRKLTRSEWAIPAKLAYNNGTTPNLNWSINWNKTHPQRWSCSSRGRSRCSWRARKRASWRFRRTSAHWRWQSRPGKRKVDTVTINLNITHVNLHWNIIWSVWNKFKDDSPTFFFNFSAAFKLPTLSRAYLLRNGSNHVNKWKSIRNAQPRSW